MTKEELFKKYSINESHSKWEPIDDWMSVEVYRVMHDGGLPPDGDKSVKWIIDFLDKIHNDIKWGKDILSRKDGGSLYLTAKRMVHSLSDEILKT